MPKKMTPAQAQALYHIELDGGLIKTLGGEAPFTTRGGRHIDPRVANWLIENGKLLGHDDGMFHECQSWEVLHPIGVQKRTFEDSTA